MTDASSPVPSPPSQAVEAYLSTLAPGPARVAQQLRDLVRHVAPEAEEAVKWSQPVFSVNGPCVYIRAFKNHVNLGFWRGATLDDPNGLLEGEGTKMRHVKIGLDDDPDLAPLAALVRAAVEANREHGDPTKG